MQYKNTKMHVQREGFSRQGIVQVVRTNVSRMRACRTFLWHSTCSFFKFNTFTAHFCCIFKSYFSAESPIQQRARRTRAGGGNWERGEERVVVMTFSSQGNKTPYCHRGGRYYRKKIYRQRYIGIFQIIGKLSISKIGFNFIQ